MSDNAVVITIAVAAFAVGVALAVRFWPPADRGRAGELAWWASRLVAGAALATFALNFYATLKNNSERDLETELEAIDLADGLSRSLYEAGVLAALSGGLALVGTMLFTRTATAERLDDDDEELD